MARQSDDRRDYERRKGAANARNRRLAAAGREIGRIPPPKDARRRRRCRLDLRRFLDTYFRATFDLPWSADHLAVIKDLQNAVVHGGQVAVAMPRGSGKTSLSVGAVIWALLYGHRAFVLLIAATEAAAVELLGLIRQDLSSEGTLLALDFPEVSVPICALEGISNRAAGQMYKGKRTNITLTDSEIVLPTVRRSPSSGAILRVAGLLGRIRGAIARLPDGATARPDLCIIDDPQTDDSAESLTQCERRERVLAGSVLGLAGPGKKIAAVATVTVIRAGDVADNLLDAQRHPEWNGRRAKLLYEEPTNVRLWERYAELRADSLREHKDLRDATAFYVANREAMDEGARVAWDQRFNPDEVSALQHAMNLKLQDEQAFAAEYQNSPILQRSSVDDRGLLSSDEIARRLNAVVERIVPDDATRLTAAIDVQQGLLYWIVVAWRDDFTGWVVAYGTYPKQDRDYFTYEGATRTLQQLTPHAGIEGALHAGLQQLTDDLLGADWAREGGATMRVSLCLIDANWRTSTDIVHAICRRSRHSQQLMASHGQFFGLGAKPLGEWSRKPGDRAGYGWRIPGDVMPRHVRFDSGLWKTFVHSRLSAMPGDAGSLTLFGSQPGRHRMLAEQLTSEDRERLRGDSRVIDMWTLKKHRDNHLLDCLVQAGVAASTLGIALPNMETEKRVRLRRRPPTVPPDSADDSEGGGLLWRRT